MRPLFNIFLRALTLLSKFLLIFFLAKFLAPAEVGKYGLIAAATGYGIYLVGAEFYVFANREVIGLEPARMLKLVRDQALVYVCLYALTIPVVYILGRAGWIAEGYVLWFFLLLLLEHLAQELNRVLVTQSEQVLASIVLFFRSGAWALLTIGVMWLVPAARTLDTVLVCWCAGGVCACLLGFRRLFRYDRSRLHEAVDWTWIRKGLRLAFPFFIASLAMKAIFTFDRYVVESSAGIEVLGAYVVFVGMAMAVISFIDAGVLDFAYPRLVALARAGNDTEFRREMRLLGVKTFGFAGLLVICCYLFAQPVVGWIGKPVYAEQLKFLYWLLLAVFIAALSYIPHLGLYARRKDKPIIVAQATGFIIFVIACMAGAKLKGAIAVPWAICLAYAWILCFKLAAFAGASASDKHRNQLS